MTVKINRFEIRTGKKYHISSRGEKEVGIYDYLLQQYLMTFYTNNFELNMILAKLCLDQLNICGDLE